jgi:hypothetical protein
MSRRFSEKPGRRERHLRRKADNRLFAKSTRDVSDEAIAQARKQDGQELLAFSTAYQEILKTIANLQGNVDTQVILDIKERIDRLYEQVCGLAGDRSEEKQGLTKLHHAITRAIRDGAEGDVEAIARLDEEARAREMHLQLLERPIIADLLYPDSPITPDELVPSLLSEDVDSFATAMGLFSDEQRRLLLTQARALLAGRDDESELDDARACLLILEDLADNGRTAH